MRNPIRSESDAFYLALGGAALTGVRWRSVYWSIRLLAARCSAVA